jgi:hypothetical protein
MGTDYSRWADNKTVIKGKCILPPAAAGKLWREEREETQKRRLTTEETEDAEGIQD